jgi:MoxR-like ATPase
MPSGESHDPAAVAATPVDLDDALRATGYLADDGLATVAWLALRMHRPLLLEGEPGTGKTALAEALAQATGAELIRLQCYEGIDAAQALYDWDFPRQVLHLRAVEAAHRGDPGELGGGELGSADPAVWERSVYAERFLLERPVLRALRSPRAVLLIDEIDRADDEFEAFLLEVLSTWSVSIPELGTVRAEVPPLVVLTSNRTRDLHDALKRRCLYHWLDHPDLDRELAIVRERCPEVPSELARQVVEVVQRLRAGERGPLGATLVKPPGVAETLDWSRALDALGAPGLDVGVAAATLGAVCKYREDDARVRSALSALLA